MYKKYFSILFTVFAFANIQVAIEEAAKFAYDNLDFFTTLEDAHKWIETQVPVVLQNDDGEEIVVKKIFAQYFQVIALGAAQTINERGDKYHFIMLLERWLRDDLLYNKAFEYDVDFIQHLNEYIDHIYDQFCEMRHELRRYGVKRIGLRLLLEAIEYSTKFYVGNSLCRNQKAFADAELEVMKCQCASVLYFYGEDKAKIVQPSNLHGGGKICYIEGVFQLDRSKTLDEKINEVVASCPSLVITFPEWRLYANGLLAETILRNDMLALNERQPLADISSAHLGLISSRSHLLELFLSPSDYPALIGITVQGHNVPANEIVHREEIENYNVIAA